jgi:spermidine dehydrogenase
MSRIKRRDFINGTLMTAGASILPIGTSGGEVLKELDPSYYPPALTGLRGSHTGSNEHAHNRAWAKKSDWGSTTDLKEAYDLIVVGGGLSGLSAAYFYQRKYGKDKRVLILDNHDDFGGHGAPACLIIAAHSMTGEGPLAGSPPVLIFEADSGCTTLWETRGPAHRVS